MVRWPRQAGAGGVQGNLLGALPLLDVAEQRVEVGVQVRVVHVAERAQVDQLGLKLTAVGAWLRLAGRQRRGQRGLGRCPSLWMDRKTHYNVLFGPSITPVMRPGCYSCDR